MAYCTIVLQYQVLVGGRHSRSGLLQRYCHKPQYYYVYLTVLYFYPSWTKQQPVRSESRGSHNGFNHVSKRSKGDDLLDDRGSGQSVLILINWIVPKEWSFRNESVVAAGIYSNLPAVYRRRVVPIDDVLSSVFLFCDKYKTVRVCTGVVIPVCASPLFSWFSNNDMT